MIHHCCDYRNPCAARAEDDRQAALAKKEEEKLARREQRSLSVRKLPRLVRRLIGAQIITYGVILGLAGLIGAEIGIFKLFAMSWLLGLPIMVLCLSVAGLSFAALLNGTFNNFFRRFQTTFFTENE